MRFPVAIVMSVMIASPTMSQQYVSGGFPATEIDLAQVPATVSGNPVRRVIADQLPLYTRPIPEAAVLDRLDVGARVPLVTEGGGWATMDLGGGFLGWMRIEGLGPDIAPAAPPPRAAAAPKIIPMPASRPADLGASAAVAAEPQPALDDHVPTRVRRF